MTADALLEPSQTRDRPTEGVHLARDNNDPGGVLELVLEEAGVRRAMSLTERAVAVDLRASGS